MKFNGKEYLWANIVDGVLNGGITATGGFVASSGAYILDPRLNDIANKNREAIMLTSNVAAILQKSACTYCRNASGETDRRGNCISCGAPMDVIK